MPVTTSKQILLITFLVCVPLVEFAQSFGYMGKKNFIGLETNFNTNIDRTYLTEFNNDRSVLRPEGLHRFNGSVGIRFERIMNSIFSNYIAINRSSTNYYLHKNFHYTIFSKNDLTDIYSAFDGLVNVKTTNLTLGQKYIVRSKSYPIGHYMSYELVIGFHTAQLDSAMFGTSNLSPLFEKMLAYKANFTSYTARVLYGKQYLLSDAFALDINVGFGIVLSSPIVYDALNDKSFDPRETDLQKALTINTRRALIYKNLIITRIALNLVY